MIFWLLKEWFLILFNCKKLTFYHVFTRDDKFFVRYQAFQDLEGCLADRKEYYQSLGI